MFRPGKKKREGRDVVPPLAAGRKRRTLNSAPPCEGGKERGEGERRDGNVTVANSILLETTSGSTMMCSRFLPRSPREGKREGRKRVGKAHS